MGVSAEVRFTKRVVLITCPLFLHLLSTRCSVNEQDKLFANKSLFSISVKWHSLVVAHCVLPFCHYNQNITSLSVDDGCYFWGALAPYYIFLSAI